MPTSERDKKDFEFIKEQVLQKKRRKVRKWLPSLLMTILMALIFGLVSAATFYYTEPKLSKYFSKEQPKKPITFPTIDPDDSEVDDVPIVDIPKDITDPVVIPGTEGGPSQEQVIVNTIEADLDDVLSMSNELRIVSYKANKSMVTISSIVKGKDIFGNLSETKIDTSGLIIGQDTREVYILVSLDRVSNASSIRLRLTESESVEAALLDYETELNLAVLTVLLEEVPPLFISNNIVVATLGESYTITQGSPIMAIGSPNGYPGSIDFGFITSRGSYATITDNRLDLFNTSIRDNKNGDGVIINLKGEVIGLITRSLKEGLNKDLNTVIGISKVKAIIERMVNNEPRVYCGIITEDMTEAAKTEHKVQNGIYVNEVQANSPAFEAGMKGGDIIMQIEDKTVMNSNGFYNTLSTFIPGDEIVISIMRTSGSTNQEKQLKIVLGKKLQ